jgi:cell division protease FtsH
MVTRWGMGRRVGLVFLAGEQEVFLGREVGLREKQGFSERTSALVDEEVQEIIKERYRYVQHLLSQHRAELECIAKALLERESLNDEELQTLLESSTMEPVSVEEYQPGTNDLSQPVYVG